ncbi:MAG: cobalamin-dependent protein [Candidatus Hydrogenedentes bacterium]|nr:cobalamin-dependent protein [Candidatus Hydrogenedentota bacterium]
MSRSIQAQHLAPGDDSTLAETFSRLSHRVHQHLALARDAQASNSALGDLLRQARAASGASGFAGVTQQLVVTNKNLQEYTQAVGEAIGTAVAAFQDLETTVNQFEQEFVLLRERIDAIRDSARQVYEIAMQSRMVAINASIQAAHIGAAGAGFAVVASEVRDLSNRTGKISDTVQDELVAVEDPLRHTTQRFEENHKTLLRAKSAVEGLEATAEAMLGEAHALSRATDSVEAIAFKQVEIQDHLDGMDRHAQWVAQAADALVPELAGTSAAVDSLWDTALPPEDRTAIASLQHFESELHLALRNDEPHRARRAVEVAVHAHLDHDEMLNRVSRAAMSLHLEQLGRALPTETVFRNGRILEDTLSAMEAQQPAPLSRTETGSEFAPSVPVVILGNAFEDYHDLGRRLVAMRMRSAGFHVIDLGLSVTNEAFVEAARKHNADVIGVSALLLHTAVWIPKLKQALQKAGLGRIKVIAGGAPFLVDPLLRDEFGADGVAGNPNEAVRLVSALVHRSRAGAVS